MYKFGKVPNLCAQFWHFARFVRGPLLNNYNLPPHGINLPLQAVTEVLPNFEKIYLLSVSMIKYYNPYLYFLVLIQIQIIQAKFCSKKARMPNWFTSLLLLYTSDEEDICFYDLYTGILIISPLPLPSIHLNETCYSPIKTNSTSENKGRWGK